MKFILIGFIFFVSCNLYSKDYAFVNLTYLIENNDEYINFLEKLKIYENKYKKELELEEEKLKKLKSEIDTGALILTDIEIQKKINEYNSRLNEFNEKINQINSKIEIYIIEASKLILSTLRKILIEISEKNNYDFILDENSILIVDNEIDISEEVSLLLNETNIQLDRILNQ